MSIEGEITQNAREIASRLQAAAMRIHKEYLEAEAEAEAVAQQLKAKSDTACTAPKRLTNFSVKIGGDYQCPACWIERNSRSALMPKQSTTKDDVLECGECGHSLTITY